MRPLNSVNQPIGVRTAVRRSVCLRRSSCSVRGTGTRDRLGRRRRPVHAMRPGPTAVHVYRANTCGPVRTRSWSTDRRNSYRNTPLIRSPLHSTDHGGSTDIKSRSWTWFRALSSLLDMAVSGLTGSCMKHTVMNWRQIAF